MDIDIESLLTEISPDSPCGENLEYDADFMAMEQAATIKPEKQFGSTIIPEEPANWADVTKLGEKLLSRTKDLRIMVLLTQAYTELYGVNGYLKGITLVSQALERYWQDIHPQLEFDGEYDPLFRVNVLSRLSDKGDIISSLRSSLLIKDISGEISVRDACSLIDGTKQECESYPGGRIRLLNELSNNENLQNLRNATNQLINIQNTLQTQLSDIILPDFSQLHRMFNMLIDSAGVDTANDNISQQENSALSTDQNNITASQNNSPPISTQNWRASHIQTREDAVLMLDKVKEYFTHYEPSHPAPIMIDRIQRLITMDFMQIINDLSPSSLGEIGSILGANNMEENE